MWFFSRNIYLLLVFVLIAQRHKQCNNIFKEKKDDIVTVIFHRTFFYLEYLVQWFQAWKILRATRWRCNNFTIEMLFFGKNLFCDFIFVRIRFVAVVMEW